MSRLMTNLYWAAITSIKRYPDTPIPRGWTLEGSSTVLNDSWKGFCDTRNKQQWNKVKKSVIIDAFVLGW